MPTADIQSSTCVYVIDDDDAMRDAMAIMLKSVGHRVEAYASGRAFLAIARSDMRGCLIVDVRMPGMTGLELQQQLAKRKINLPLIFVTGHGNVTMAVRAMRAEAFDFIEKPFDDELLLDRVTEALRDDMRRRPRRHWQAEAQKRWQGLTSREQEVSELIAIGLLNKQIAGELGISIRTVENHRARAMAKLGAASMAELIGMYLSLPGKSLPIPDSQSESS